MTSMLYVVKQKKNYTCIPQICIYYNIQQLFPCLIKLTKLGDKYYHAKELHRFIKYFLILPSQKFPYFASNFFRIENFSIHINVRIIFEIAKFRVCQHGGMGKSEGRGLRNGSLPP